MTNLGGWRSIGKPALVALLPVLVCCQSLETPNGPRWGEPESIETGPAGVQRAQVAIDAMGNAIAVWDQTDRATGPLDESEDIWSNRCNTEGQWGTAELLEEPVPLLRRQHSPVGCPEISQNP